MSDNLHPQIKRNMEQSERDGGVHLDSIYRSAIVRTKNSMYTIRRVGRFLPTKPDNTFTIQGGSRFPEAVECKIHGSTWGGSMLKVNFLGVGMHMEMFVLDGAGSTITTSPIQSIEVPDAGN